MRSFYRIPSMRKAISLWLMALLLGVSPAGAWAALLRSSAECGMQCCRTKRKCCCRKPKSNPPTSAAFTAKECRGACCQPLALGGGLVATHPDSSLPREPILPAEAVCLLPAAVARNVNTCYALWQRPPPLLQPPPIQG